MSACAPAPFSLPPLGCVTMERYPQVSDHAHRDRHGWGGAPPPLFFYLMRSRIYVILTVVHMSYPIIGPVSLYMKRLGN